VGEIERWKKARRGVEHIAGPDGPVCSRFTATFVSLAAAVPDNVWLRSSDPAVESHRLRDFNVPRPEGGMQPAIVHAGRCWLFSSTYFERDQTGSETRWLLFLDHGPADREHPE
jgi:hypothetical protein